MTDVHGSILAWFLQGGQASAARVWSLNRPSRLDLTAGADCRRANLERDTMAAAAR